MIREIPGWLKPCREGKLRCSWSADAAAGRRSSIAATDADEIQLVEYVAHPEIGRYVFGQPLPQAEVRYAVRRSRSGVGGVEIASTDKSDSTLHEPRPQKIVRDPEVRRLLRHIRRRISRPGNHSTTQDFTEVIEPRMKQR